MNKLINAAANWKDAQESERLAMQELHKEIKAAHAMGMSQMEISRVTRIHRLTVIRALER